MRAHIFYFSGFLDEDKNKYNDFAFFYQNTYKF
jgi:hypothetical protein